MSYPSISLDQITVRLMGIMNDRYLFSLDGSRKIYVKGLSKQTLKNFGGVKVRAVGHLYFIGKSALPRLELKTFSAI